MMLEKAALTFIEIGLVFSDCPCFFTECEQKQKKKKYEVRERGKGLSWVQFPKLLCGTSVLCKEKVMKENFRKIVKKVRCFYPCLFLVLIFIVIVRVEMELFTFDLSKAFIAAGSRTISSLLIKMGFSGGLALTVAWAINFLFCEESCNMMVSSGSGSGEGFRWTDLFGSSSPSPEGSGNPPAPGSPNPAEPAAPIADAEDYHPLQEDGQRRRELCDRLTINNIGHPLPEEVFDQIIDTQFQTELRIEKALRSDRVQEDSFLEKRHQIRGILFYPNGRAFSLETYVDHLKKIENHGAHRSLPYRRLQDAISKKEFFLDFDGIKKRRE